MVKVKEKLRNRNKAGRFLRKCAVAAAAATFVVLISNIREQRAVSSSLAQQESGVAVASSGEAFAPLTTVAYPDPSNPLGIPQGQAPALPSIRVEDTQLEKMRRKYGGKGDKAHLGGFSEMDVGGISIPTFKYMVEKLGVKSLIDIGCGRGFSTSWFVLHGVDAICAEGSHDGVLRTIIPESEKRVFEHDFSRGPWWPAKTYDAAWSVEFLEHVGVNFHVNYVAAFRKAALLFVTASSGTGWHHVEVHKPAWWIRKYESYGFRYNDELTQELRELARAGKKVYKAPNGVYLDGFYVRVNMMVFVNPVVASLPEHAHLFPEIGCTNGKGNNRPCKKEYGESELPDSFQPLNLTQAMEDAWMDLIKANVMGMPK